MSWYEYNYYPRSYARPAKGGIKAQSRRGQFGQSWWARRWIEVLESFDIGARLGRGRSYARSGQVLSIDIEKGRVKARVQGSRPSPYQITIKVKTLARKEWEKLAGILSKQAIYAAKLLAGEMPENIEEAFLKAQLSLFPDKRGDLQTDCSCPDWSNPCKHIAAVYYLLGEEFDRDPFLIFKLRGMERKELLGLLHGLGADKQKAVSSSENIPPEERVLPAEPLPADPKQFWPAALAEADGAGEVAIPPLAAALPKRLGNFPFWRGEENFLSALEPIYQQVSPLALEVFLGQKKADTDDADKPASRRRIVKRRKGWA